MKIKATFLATAISLAPMSILLADEVRETITTSSGVVSEAEPDTLVVTGDSAPAMHYRFTKTTRYVDEDGNPVTVEVIKRGTPVTVQYVKQGDALVASRVVVRTKPSVTREVITATTAQPVEVTGAVTEFADGALAVRSEGSAHPIRFAFTKATKWVDAEGNEVTSEIVRRGTPVTVIATQNGERAEVAKVIVHKSPVVIEKKTTTTTTTTAGEK
jgi:hypothetical protein